MKIHGIIDSNNQWSEDQGVIENIFLNHFQNLFTSSKPNKDYIEKVLNSVSKRVDSRMNETLIAPFTRHEVKKVVFQMFPKKHLALMVSWPFFTKNIGKLWALILLTTVWTS